MAKKYKGSFSIPGGFEVNNPVPRDDRDVVELDSDLLSDTELDNIFEGIIVYSEESQSHYKWNGQDRTKSENWKGIGLGLIEQIIDSGGNYNNLELTGNVIQFTNTNAQAIVNGFSFEAYKRITLINNSDFDVRLNAEDTNSDENKRIKLPTGLTNMGIQGTTELVYVDSIERWQIVDSFASKYRPEHRGLDEFEVEVVGPGAISETREIIELMVFKPSVNSDLSKADLNNDYSDEENGFQVVCPLLNKIYIKFDKTNGVWHSIDTTTIS
jgi:hypothetical protein